MDPARARQLLDGEDADLVLRIMDLRAFARAKQTLDDYAARQKQAPMTPAIREVMVAQWGLMQDRAKERQR